MLHRPVLVTKRASQKMNDDLKYKIRLYESVLLFLIVKLRIKQNIAFC